MRKFGLTLAALGALGMFAVTPAMADNVIPVQRGTSTPVLNDNAAVEEIRHRRGPRIRSRSFRRMPRSMRHWGPMHRAPRVRHYHMHPGWYGPGFAPMHGYWGPGVGVGSRNFSVWMGF